MIPPAQQQALASLLADEDPETRRLLIAEIAAQRPRYEAAIRAFATAPDHRLRQSAAAILRHWDLPTPPPESPSSPPHPPLEPSAGPQTWSDLENFCWTLARTEYPQLDPTAYARTLDHWAARCLQVAGPQPTPADKARALRLVLAGEMGCRGNRADYYAPANSYLHRVIETRLGIPLTLSLLYTLTALRAHWPAWGVNTPGHYLMAVEDVILDPYFGGTVLSPETLAARFALPLATCSLPDFFHASPRDTAQRMLANLLNAYQHQGDTPRARRIRAYLHILQENSP